MLPDIQDIEIIAEAPQAASVMNSRRSALSFIEFLRSAVTGNRQLATPGTSNGEGSQEEGELEIAQ